MLRRSLQVLKKGYGICTISRQKLYTAAYPVFYARFDKDLPNPNLPQPASKLYGPDTDILLDQLKKCKSLDKLLELISMHLSVMNSRHIVTCLENIHNCIKENSGVAENLLMDPVFKSFCARLMKMIRLFNTQEVINSYKALCAMEVRSNTYVMQSVLKMLGAHLNSMSLGQLTFLSFLLHKQRHNSLVDGLRLALPLVLQVQIDQQLDSDNLTEVVNCLQLSCRANLKPATIQKIVNCILKKASILSTEDAVTTIFAMLNIDTPVDGYNELLNIAFETVSKNIEELSHKKIITILRACRSQHFYHFKYFYTVANLVVSQKFNLEMTYSALSQLYLLDFCPSNLLDHFADVLCLESEHYHSDSSYSPLNCIEYLTSTSHRPVNIDKVARILYSDDEKFENMSVRNPHLFVKFLSCLAMLGHFPHELLSKVLSVDFLTNAWRLSKKIGRGSEFESHILYLIWSLKIYDETDNFVIPPAIFKKVIHSVYQKNMNAEYPLAKFIEIGLGGSQFLQSGVFTEDGLVIDHVVAMRSGNYPLSLENIKLKDRKDKSVQHLLFIEDIVIPEDAKIIAVIVANEEDYFRELEILRGWVDLKVKFLAKKNYGTVIVNFSVWKNLPDREKIPYLMQEIKLAIPSDCSIKSNYS